jgi:hypothetical protein
MMTYRGSLVYIPITTFRDTLHIARTRYNYMSLRVQILVKHHTTIVQQ